MIRKLLAAMTEGIANTTMNEVTSCAQTKTGMRFSDMPGARCLKIVVISCTATASEARSR